MEFDDYGTSCLFTASRYSKQTQGRPLPLQVGGCRRVPRWVDVQGHPHVTQRSTSTDCHRRTHERLSVLKWVTILFTQTIHACALPTPPSPSTHSTPSQNRPSTAGSRPSHLCATGRARYAHSNNTLTCSTLNSIQRRGNDGGAQGCCEVPSRSRARRRCCPCRYYHHRRRHLATPCKFITHTTTPPATLGHHHNIPCIIACNLKYCRI